MEDISTIKREFRTEMARRKRAIPISEATIYAEQLFSQFEKWELYQNAHTILLYYSLPDELPTHAFIQKSSPSKTILLPAIANNNLELRIYEDSNSLQIGAYHIAEPIGKPYTDYDTIDLCLIPGVAFDKKGIRLGRGKGYYDRFLPLLQAPKVGIGYDCQLIEDVLPEEPHDIRMDYLFTEARFLQIKPSIKKDMKINK